MTAIKKFKAFKIVIISTVLLLSSISAAQIINPETYYSANKQFSLKVIPINKYGIGQSDITLRYNIEQK